MSNIYDRWERIVEAVMRREHDRELALAHSRDPSTSSISSSSNFISDFPFHYQNLQLEASTSRLNDAEWKIFLPSDYKKIISRSVTPVTYKTAEDLNLNLCDSPILLDGGKMSFHIDKITGKKCYMIGARELLISWSDTPRKWTWTSHVDSRFLLVAELLNVWWLEIRGKIQTKMLSPKTSYAAYLVFKLGEEFSGLGSVNGIIRLVNREEDSDAAKRARPMHLQPVEGGNGQIAAMRSDGWMEVEMGNFYNNQRDNGIVEARLLDTTFMKSGLIVEGIEFRPTAHANFEEVSEEKRGIRIFPKHEACNSNTVNDKDWEILLPSDYEEIISRSVDPVAYENKKDLYLSFCDAPILLDGGNMSFHLDKKTGKKCYMIGARGLVIVLDDIPLFWGWTSHINSRFSTVAELRIKRRLDIRGQIDKKMLSPKTHYAVYLVFRLTQDIKGLGSANGIIRFFNHDAEKRTTTVHLQPAAVDHDINGQLAVRRPDRWMEVQLGNFYNDQPDGGPVEAGLLSTTNYEKWGLIVEGIEFRPPNANIAVLSKQNARVKTNGLDFSNLRILDKMEKEYSVFP